MAREQIKKEPQPPRWLQLPLRWFCTPAHLEVIEGDLLEMYNLRFSGKGRTAANIGWITDTVKCLRPGLIRRFLSNERTNSNKNPMMIGNHFKVARRNLVKHWNYSLINIGGLVIGFAACIVIGVFVHTELSYDRYHTKSPRIHRLVLDLTARGEKLPWAIATGKWGPRMVSEIPGVINHAALIPNWGNKSLVEYGDKKFYEARFGWADSAVTEIFDFQFITTSDPIPLRRPGAIIISESVASKYFVNEDPLGKILRRDDETDYQVTGVFQDIPTNSHFHLDLIASLQTASKEERDGYWGYSYVELHEDTDPAAIDKALGELLEKYAITKPNTAKLYLQPLTDIHLHSNLMYEFESVGNLKTIYIMVVVGGFILAITCINFINISTAFAMKKVNEIGIRKTLGATRINLIVQNLLETLMVSAISIVAAYLLARLLIPGVEDITGKSLILTIMNNPSALLWVALTVVVVGVAAGAYPAFYLSGFKPGLAVKGGGASAKSKAHFRKALVVLQFSISVILICGALTAYQQLNFMQNKDLGMSGDQVLGVSIVYAQNIRDSYQSFKNEALAYEGIENITRISNFPMELTSMWVGTFKLQGASDDEVVRSKWFTVDHDFLPTLSIQLKEGRDFSKDFVTDSSRSVLMNEAAAKSLGVTNPLGSEIELVGYDRKMEVVGIVEDFHFASLHNEIEPLLIFMGMGDNTRLAIKLKGNNISGAMDDLEKVWSKYEPSRPMESQFLDSYFNEKYSNEKTIMKFIVVLTILAIIIAGLGLYGLAAYVLQLRLKEVGLRKILGASNGGLLALLTRDFVKLVLISALLAIPFSIVFLNSWLEEFPYRVELGPGIFILAVGLAVVITMITIGYRSLTVANCNPVETLRDE